MSEGGTGADMRVRIEPLTEGDIESVARLAAEIWRQHYPGIISAAQIEYMLRQRYDPLLLRAELGSSDIWWDKLLLDEAIVAFSSCLLTGAGEMKLDKLYVHPRHQRKGCGGALIAVVCERARAAGCSGVILAVNKRNASAIAAYLKHGFRIRESVVKNIGGGFVMDDYIMDKRVAGPANA